MKLCISFQNKVVSGSIFDLAGTLVGQKKTFKKGGKPEFLRNACSL